jgi:hypothetical protein
LGEKEKIFPQAKAISERKEKITPIGKTTPERKEKIAPTRINSAHKDVS